MNRFFIGAFLCILCTLPLFAQDEFLPNEDSSEDIVYKMNEVGDQYMALKLNVIIPYRPFGNLKIGGSGSIGYERFITDGFTLGGDVSFAYMQTIGDNVFYIVPFMVMAGYQFSLGRFEIPISIGIGGTLQNYIDRTYFGLTIRPALAAYYRFTPDWSFGIHTNLYVLPQWYKNTDFNYVGLIHEIGLAARYHF